MSTRDATRKAADAARSLLNDRIAAVKKLSLALHDYHTAQDAVTQAQTRADELANHARTAFQEARTAGWTAAELRRAGLTVPQPPRAKNTPRPPATTDDDDDDAPTPEATSD